MAIARSPLAPKRIVDLPALAGVDLATAACRIRYQARSDVCLMVLAPGSTVAGVLTRSLTAAAPVEWCRNVLPRGRARAIVVNSGNANAFTGAAGVASVEETVAALAGHLDCTKEEIFVASTGVIGEPLPTARLTGALDDLVAALRPEGWLAAAEAIMTTDTFPKLATRETEIAGAPVRINGIAKGSGMIAPDMATMLSFVVTDAAIAAPALRPILAAAADASFNAITVDGDTSTSDTVLLCATGQADHAPIGDAKDPALRGFKLALGELMTELAQLIARDGEGARKFITIRVTGAASKRAARRIGLSIGNSPLVKTAVAGADANWGRIVMAVGKAGEKADRDRLAIRIGGCDVARNGMAVTDFDEAPVARHMAGSDIDIEVDVGVGRGRATVWTCDLTHGYIDINADYRS